tara:strand:+ start:9330 stop:10136 length:807 start_codon:yes stop_codon:yes gene_type:complete
MTEETIAFSEGNEGFSTRYSFIPESMVELNNNFYSFKSGNIHKHTTDAVRNNFYGIQYPTRITTVFNQDPTSNKLVKSISIEGTHPWKVNAISDLQTSGLIEAEWFEKKEGSWFAFMRNEGLIPVTNEELASRSVQGIGMTESVDSSNLAAIILSFSVNPLLTINPAVSIGDILYHSIPPYDTPLLAGKITGTNVDLQNDVNEIIIDSTFNPSTVPILLSEIFCVGIKNPIAESGGIRGHYCEVVLENNSEELTEIFTVEAEVFKSFP